MKIEKIRDLVKDYFVNMLLLRWIWVFGLLAIGTFFLFYGQVQGTFDIYESIRTASIRDLSFFQIWTVITSSVLINYSISFSVKYKFPRTEVLFFLVSLLSLSVLYFHVVPNFF